MIWVPVTNFQPLERFLLVRVYRAGPGEKGLRAMEVKIFVLLALIAAIATAAHYGARSQSQERAN
jgi:hypothetical protein